jgi:hypothetical protein
MWVDDADEYKSVDHLARSSWEYYWTGWSYLLLHYKVT